MGHWKSSLILIAVILHLAMNIHSRFEFTNANCTSLDTKFGEYLHLPELNLVLMKRFNGYKPFLYNITFNACNFLANTKSNPVAKFFYDSILNFTNLNHTCPYNHDIILDKIPADFVNQRLTKVVPFPEGDYLIEAHWFSSGSRFAVVKVYGTLS